MRILEALVVGAVVIVILLCGATAIIVGGDYLLWSDNEWAKRIRTVLFTILMISGSLAIGDMILRAINK